MPTIVKVKDPDARLDYGLDWSDWLEEGDMISESTWLAEEGIVIDGDEHDSDRTVVWLSGGEAGKVYRITNRIHTIGGRVDDFSFLVRVEEK